MNSIPSSISDLPQHTYTAGTDYRQRIGLYTQDGVPIAVNLRYQQLTNFPDWLCELDSLQFIDISGNQLQAFSESIAQLDQLQVLLADDNQLRIS